MKYKHNVRLVLKGYRGEVPAAFSLTLTSDSMWQAALKQKLISGLARYREERQGHKDKDSFTDDGIGVLPIGLSSYLVWDADVSTLGFWTPNLPGTQLIEFPNPFRGNVPGLGHIDDAPGSYTSKPVGQAQLIEMNTGFAIRLFIHKAPKEIVRSVLTLAWSVWRFRITDGGDDNGAAIYRHSANWTAQNEAILNALLEIENPTVAEQDTINELREAMYLDYTPISLNGDTANNFGTFYELAFQPEPCGRIAIYEGGEFVGQAEYSELLQKRVNGVVWAESALTVERNGGHFIWQNGWWHFGNVGTYRAEHGLSNTGGVLFQHISSADPARGQTVTFAIDATYITATLSTTNPRRTPYLYALHAFKYAGLRDGDPVVSLDTDTLLDVHGYSPIMDAEPQSEGEHRRTQYSLMMRDVKGQTFAGLGFNGGTTGLARFLEVGEHRVCDQYIGGVRVLTDGIVRDGTLFDMKSAQRNVPRATVARSTSKARLLTSDEWALLEEYEMDGGEIVGDFLHWGEVLRRSISLIGTPNSRLAGISPTEGKYFRPAVQGEGWSLVNDAGTLAEWVLYLVERFGMGRSVWQNGRTGIWQAGFRSRDIKVIGGHPMHFTADPEKNRALTYPGRCAILRPLDMPRDTTDFFNAISMDGAPGVLDSKGRPLSRRATLYGSIRSGTGLGEPTFLGRKKKMKHIQDSSIRDEDDLEWAMRSTMRKHFKPGRFFSFETYFHEELSIGDVGTVHGILAECVRQPTGSSRRDKSAVLFQELGKTGVY